jgi:acyl-ACP thioesterase
VDASAARTSLAHVVRLGDVAPSGRLRLDALAAYLQDVADDDAARWNDDGAGTWVLRRLDLDIDWMPAFRDTVHLETWCSGRGGYWAERSTVVDVGGRKVASARGVWVSVDAAGRPRRVPEWFAARFADLAPASAETSRAATRLTHAAPGADAVTIPWTARAVDFDVLDHVNNAVAYAAVEEVLAHEAPGRTVVHAEAEYAGPIVRGERVDLSASARRDGVACWLGVDGEVRTSAVLHLAPGH